MSVFRRREPLHERLAREGGLDEPRPVDTRPWWGEVGIHGVPRPREWDAVVSVDAELAGERAAFWALPDGTVVVDEGPDEVVPLADALERALAPPYRAEAVRRPDGTWAVGASHIRVEQLPETPGSQLTLTATERGVELVVDGEQVFGSAPALVALLDGGSGVVQATRIDGDAFQVSVHPL